MRVVTGEVFLYALLVPAFCLSDALSQISLGLFVSLQVPRLKRRILYFKQSSHFALTVFVDGLCVQLSGLYPGIRDRDR